MLRSEQKHRTPKSTLLMKQTLLSFLEEMPLSSIKVSALCKRCHINRATFYAYYCDIYDLVNAIEADIVQELHEIMAIPNPPFLTATEIANRFLSYLYQHRTSLRLLLSGDTRLNFARQLNQILTEFLEQSVYEQYDIPASLSPDEFEKVLGFVVFGHYSYYARFIFDGAPCSDEDIASAAKLFADLSECCLQQHFHLKPKE